MNHQPQNSRPRVAASECVLSAMSGGVDSSVATMLLMEEGYKVQGVTMQLFDDTATSCLDDAEDARAVCGHLGISHTVLDLRDSFSMWVIHPFCASYLSSETPNPCIYCNRHLKFAKLQKYRRQTAAQYVATGHYARRAFDPLTKTWQLLRATDHDKDQSYVLYHLTQEDLAHTLFPLGSLEKEQVRQLAAQHGFANAQKPESQDICFIPDGDYVAFIQERLMGPSKAVLAPGRYRGRNRRGTRAPQRAYPLHHRPAQGLRHRKPRAVVREGKNPRHNRLVVAPHERLMTSHVKLRDVNVISGNYRPRTTEVTVKLSYRQQPVAARIQLLDHREALVQLETPQVRPAPGQAVVAYVGEVVLAGGTVTL